jgi:hypothetical protein
MLGTGASDGGHLSSGVLTVVIYQCSFDSKLRHKFVVKASVVVNKMIVNSEGL